MEFVKTSLGKILLAGRACALVLYSCKLQDESVLEQQPVKFSFDLRGLSSTGGRVRTTDQNVAAVAENLADKDGNRKFLHAKELPADNNKITFTKALF